MQIGIAACKTPTKIFSAWAQAEGDTICAVYAPNTVIHRVLVREAVEVSPCPRIVCDHLALPNRSVPPFICLAGVFLILVTSETV
jgi:hypothetical protein